MSVAALDRIFPAALGFGPAFLAVADLVRGSFNPGLWRVVAGAGLGLAVLGTVSLSETGGLGTASAFVANSRKHTETPLTNYIGLPTLFSKSLRSVGPNDDLKALRTRTFSQRRAMYWSAVAIALAYTAWVCWRVREPWQAVLAGLLPLFCLFDVTNYYYVMLVLLAPLAVGRLDRLLVLLGASLAGQVFQQHGLGYTSYSLLVLALLIYFVTAMGFDARVPDDPLAATKSAR